MSWSWKDELDVGKVYEPGGSVTITTEEYRDLLSAIFKLQMAGQREHDDWREEYNKRQSFEKEVQSLEERIATINNWFSENNEAKLAYKNWKYCKFKEQEESDNG